MQPERRNHNWDLRAAGRRDFLDDQIVRFFWRLISRVTDERASNDFVET